MDRSGTELGSSDPMGFHFTAVFKQVPEGYIGFVMEVPGANAQGANLSEARSSLRDALLLVLLSRRELSREEFGARGYIREALR